MNFYYNMILQHYTGKTAKRSGLPYINHIDEGLKILNITGALSKVKDAWCVHPLFQDDKALIELSRRDLFRMDPTVVMFAMEYRTVANAYRSVNYKPDFVPKLSTIHEVNMMLVADKVQNMKDFWLHQEYNEHLFLYYSSWLRALGISEDEYMELKNLIT